MILPISSRKTLPAHASARPRISSWSILKTWNTNSTWERVWKTSQTLHFVFEHESREWDLECEWNLEREWSEWNLEREWSERNERRERREWSERSERSERNERYKRNERKTGNGNRRWRNSSLPPSLPLFDSLTLCLFLSLTLPLFVSLSLWLFDSLTLWLSM